MEHVPRSQVINTSTQHPITMHWSIPAGVLTTALLLFLSFQTLRQHHRKQHRSTKPPRTHHHSNVMMDLDDDPSDDPPINPPETTNPTSNNLHGPDFSASPDPFDHQPHQRPTSKLPFVSASTLHDLEQALQSIVVIESTSTPHHVYNYQELSPQLPFEETSFYDPDQPQSAKTAAKYGPRLQFTGQSTTMSYLSSAVFVVDSEIPEIGDHLHFSGQASFSDELTVNLHLSTPPGDNFWYVTLKDIIKKNNKGENQTPVIAYTDCKLNPWQEGHGCLWMVHEGPQIGWKKSSTLKLKLVR